MLLCMRTTLDVDDAVLIEAKLLAKRTGKTLTSIVEDALRERLARRPAAEDATWARLPTGGSGGLQPGVNLDDNASLLDLMDAPN